MKYKELKEKTNADLLKLLRNEEKALLDFNVGSSGGKARNVKEKRAIKKNIARILTEAGARGRK